jgi:aryl-alcohol dehydrogenase-like predicted oxidoreductase
VSPTQLAIAWALAQGDDIVALIGTRQREKLAEGLRTLDLKLGADELKHIAAAVPSEMVAGTRYGVHEMQVLDSER